MAVLGSLPTVRAQIARTEHFAAAFSFAEEAGRTGSAAHQQLFTLVAGQTERTDLPGGAFALSQAYLTKPRAEAKWETHRAYIDVQVVYAGAEFMELADRSRMTLAEDLTPERDVIFYQAYENGTVTRFEAGDVGIYFPTDAHRGGIVVGTPTLVRKVVVKVPVLSA